MQHAAGGDHLVNLSDAISLTHPEWIVAMWGCILAVALVVFYVLLTPIWLGLRGLAWLAEFRARRRREH